MPGRVVIGAFTDIVGPPGHELEQSATAGLALEASQAALEPRLVGMGGHDGLDLGHQGRVGGGQVVIGDGAGDHVTLVRPGQCGGRRGEHEAGAQCRADPGPESHQAFPPEVFRFRAT